MADIGEIELGELSDRELLLLTAKTVNQLCGQISRQNERINQLEQWRSQAIGALAIIAIAVSALVSWLVGHV